MAKFFKGNRSKLEQKAEQKNTANPSPQTLNESETASISGGAGSDYVPACPVCGYRGLTIIAQQLHELNCRNLSRA